MRLSAPPGVFTPIADTWLLARAVERELAGRGSVLDLCTGSGAVAIAAARAGAGEVTAVDASRRSVLAARLNARRNGVRVAVLRGDLFAPVAGRRFDLIASNPPYVPAGAGDDGPGAHGPRRSWDGGRDGRAVLDRICAGLPAHLRPGGVALLAHSSLCGERPTVEDLRDAGFEARVVDRLRGPLGPLMRARAPELERAGMLEPGTDEEELLVVRARAT
jgi:release factor glutamine methyltransferase